MTPLEWALLTGVVLVGLVALCVTLSAVEDDDAE